MLFVMVPASVGLAVLAPDVVRLVYQGGRFDAEATLRVARALRCYAAGLAVFGFNKAIVPWFHAQKDMRTPLRVSVRMVLANLALNAAAVFGLPVEWRHVGIAFATVATSVGTCAWLLALARRRNGPLGLGALRGDLGQMLPAAAAMGLLLFSLRFFSARWFGSLGWAGSAIMLALLVAIGAGLYAFFIAGFKAYDRRRHASR
jgi:putative peptidoglycan lipid II flippase